MAIVFTREMVGWEPVCSEPDRVVFRPGPQAIKSLLGYAALAAGLSVIFYIGGARGQIAAIVVHILLWLIAVSWPLSILYQRMEFSKDAAAGVVRVRGQGVLFPFRRDFPLGGGTSLSLARHKHHSSTGRGSSGVHVGWNWQLLVMGAQAMTIQIGHTAGREPPSRPPLEVRRALDQLSEIFEAPVQTGYGEE